MDNDQPPQSEQKQLLIAPPDTAGMRFDAVAAQLFGDYSRSRLQDWIKRGFLTASGPVRRPSDKLIGGEEISLILPPDALADTWEEIWAKGAASMGAEPIPIDLVHSDEQFYIVNKQVPMVMHPAPGNRTGTIMNGLLNLEPGLRTVPRAGIVHRLDKETSGLCVVARTLKAHSHLVAQLQARTVSREYLAIVVGDIEDSGIIDEPIGRHPRDRKKMAVVESGKPARTHFQVLERFIDCALVSVKLETGRTHQIRVHMTHLGYPLLGDPVYGLRGTRNIIKGMNLSDVTNFGRQALHAHSLGLKHPLDESECRYQIDPPADFNHVLVLLRNAAAAV